MAEYILETVDLDKPVVLYIENSGGTFLAVDSGSGHPYPTSFSGARWFDEKEDVSALIRAAEQTVGRIRILRVSELKLDDITVQVFANAEYERELAILNKRYNRT